MPASLVAAVRTTGLFGQLLVVVCRQPIGRDFLKALFPPVSAIPLGFGFRLFIHFAFPFGIGVLIFSDGLLLKQNQWQVSPAQSPRNNDYPLDLMCGAEGTELLRRRLRLV